MHEDASPRRALPEATEENHHLAEAASGHVTPTHAPQPGADTVDDPGVSVDEPGVAVDGAQNPGHPASPLRSHMRAFMRPGRGQMVVAVVLALTAMLVVLTLRTQAAQPEHANLRREELIQLLDGMSAETRRLEAEIRNLQSTRDELASGAEGAEAAELEARRRLDVLQILAGTVPVHGPGIRITIEDPQHDVSPELLLDALEELRDAGAEVIEFNDQVRVVASTWLGLDDKGRLVADDQVLEVPITIEAIGDPPTLEAGARFRGGLVSQLEGERVRGTVTIEQLDDVRIDSLATVSENEFALPN